MNLGFLKRICRYLSLMMICGLPSLHADTPDGLLPDGGALPPHDALGLISDIAGDEDFVLIGIGDATVEGIQDLGGAVIMAPNAEGQWLEQRWIPGTEVGLDRRARFGNEVDIDGDHFYVGAFRADRSPDAQNSGAVFEFRRDPASGQVDFLRRIDRPEPNTASFGSGVAADGGWLAVGATLGEGPLPDSNGATYLFRWEESVADWVYEQKLLAHDRPEGQVLDDFGMRVKLAYPWLAVWGRNAWVEEEEARLGATYMYRHDPESGEWVFTQRLVGDAPEQGRETLEYRLVYLGENHLMLMGEDRSEEPMSGRVRLYIHELDVETDQWERSAIMENPDPVEGYNDTFGWSATLTRSGERLIVGEPAARDEAGALSGGALHVFRRDASEATGWRLLGELTPTWRSWDNVGHRLGLGVVPAGSHGVAARGGGPSALGHAYGNALVFQPEAAPVHLRFGDAWPEAAVVRDRSFDHHWRVENQGEATASNVFLRLQRREDAFELTAANVPCWWQRSAQSDICLIKSIPPGGHVTVTTRMEALVAGDHEIALQLVSDQVEENESPLQDSVTISVSSPGSGSGCSLGRGPYELLILLFVAYWRLRRQPFIDQAPSH